ncbi:MAG: hypothetical protein RR548_04945 [Carnobacterium sp.]|uniref:hypothetical protein n=1 Tax=Carnobacterium sp. TaxID=48221 RepID=UPI002FCB5B0D
MSINTFAEKATKFLSVLDQIYARESLTSMLETSGVKFDGTKTVKYPKISMDGAGDYDRDAGYAQGSVSVEYESKVLEFDRGRKFRIDVLDDDEAAFELFRTAVTEYVRTKEIPETDAIRFSRLCTYAGKTVASDTFTSPVDLYDDAEQYLTDAEVTSGDLIMYCSAEFYKALKNDPKIQRRINSEKVIQRNVTSIDEVTEIIKVPRSRFYDVIELLDGKTAGKTAGGFKYTVGTSHEVNFILLPKSVAKAITKRKNTKIINPDVNQSADAYDVMYRTFHDLIVDDNKKKAIYVHKKATALAK